MGVLLCRSVFAPLRRLLSYSLSCSSFGFFLPLSLSSSSSLSLSLQALLLLSSVMLVLLLLLFRSSYCYCYRVFGFLFLWLLLLVISDVHISVIPSAPDFRPGALCCFGFWHRSQRLPGSTSRVQESKSKVQAAIRSVLNIRWPGMPSFDSTARAHCPNGGSAELPRSVPGALPGCRHAAKFEEALKEEFAPMLGFCTTPPPPLRHCNGCSSFSTRLSYQNEQPCADP